MTNRQEIKKFAAPRGTADILPQDISSWQRIESAARKIFKLYGYREIRTPIFEETAVFTRSMGQTSDVVQKQLLSVVGSFSLPVDRGGEQHVLSMEQLEMRGLYSLRPEGTAAIVRSYIENSLDMKESLSKFFYLGPMFRGERPQKGRLRQFHQIGVEAIGPHALSPYLDAEVIALSTHILNSLRLKDFKIKINTLGTIDDKEGFANKLINCLEQYRNELCVDCQDRLSRNPFRILDCKNPQCKEVVKKLGFILEMGWLSEESRKYFDTVKDSLDDLDVKFEVDPTLVRGLDYYYHTVFEISSPALGSQDALGAGGRYNNLVEQLGGPSVGAVGFALGIERILLALKQKLYKADRLDIYIIALDENSMKKASSVLGVLRKNGYKSDMSYAISSMKSQMRLADKMNPSYVIILGENELRKGVVSLKDMKTGNQQELSNSEYLSMLFKLFMRKRKRL